MGMDTTPDLEAGSTEDIPVPLRQDTLMAAHSKAAMEDLSKATVDRSMVDTLMADPSAVDTEMVAPSAAVDTLMEVPLDSEVVLSKVDMDRLEDLSEVVADLMEVDLMEVVLMVVVPVSEAAHTAVDLEVVLPKLVQ